MAKSDPTSYHLYCEDSSGHPGTILTFFLWPGVRRGRVGSSQVTATSFAIPVACRCELLRAEPGTSGGR